MLTAPLWVIKHKFAFSISLYFFIHIPKLTEAVNDAARATQEFADAMRANIPMDDWDLEDDAP
jgi:hypothetical protein